MYYKIKEGTLVAIADAIRGKNASSDYYNPAEMAAAIGKIKTGSAELNVAYGDTAPEDTSVLWVKAAQPQKSCLVAGFGYGSEKMQVGVGALPGGVWGVACKAASAQAGAAFDCQVTACKLVFIVLLQ